MLATPLWIAMLATLLLNGFGSLCYLRPLARLVLGQYASYAPLDRCARYVSLDLYSSYAPPGSVYWLRPLWIWMPAAPSTSV